MKFSTVLHEQYLIIELQEEKLTTTIAPQLKSQFITWNAEGKNNIILDLSHVQYADSSGLSALLRGRSLAENSGGIFVLVSLNPHVEKLIKISQLDSILNILPTRQEGIEAVFMHTIESELVEEGEEELDSATDEASA